MNSQFSFIAFGDHFDVDLFLAKTPLHCGHIWHAGNGYQYSGFSTAIGDGLTLSLDEQEGLAAEYLTKNRDLVETLYNEPGVECCMMRLHYCIDPEWKATGVVISPAQQLMRITLDLNVKLSYFIQLIPKKSLG